MTQNMIVYDTIDIIIQEKK